jgi:RNA polymerase sigma-70 factor, ECF subfamily
LTALAELNDEQLMEILAKGEIRPLGELFQRHAPMVKAALQRFAPELAEAHVDELSQDVFLALHDSADRYEEQSKFKAWIFGIAVRKARAWRRKTWLRRNLLKRHGGLNIAMALPTGTTPDTSFELREQAQIMLSQMTQKQREVVLLHAVEGFSCEEIAQILKVRVGVVWTRLYRARLAVAAASQINSAKPAYEGES